MTRLTLVNPETEDTLRSLMEGQIPPGSIAEQLFCNNDACTHLCSHRAFASGQQVKAATPSMPALARIEQPDAVTDLRYTLLDDGPLALMVLATLRSSTSPMPATLYI